MILIDKTLPTQTLIVTVSENIISSSNTLKLKVESRVNNVNHEVTLPANSSPFPTRYDKYEIPTSTFLTWTTGRYMYNIIEMNGTTEVSVLEIGIVEVVGEPIETYQALPIESTDDDYIVYQ